MDAVERLIAAIDASGIKHVRIAADAGMDKSRFSKIYNRRQLPNALEYFEILRAIGRDPARVITEGELLVAAERLRAAHVASVELLDVSARLTAILEEMLPKPEVAGTVGKRQAPHTAFPVGAAANPNAEMVVEIETKLKRIPRRAWARGARIIARVKGDSMNGGADPIRDGELAYLRKTTSVRAANGKIALVRREDALYLKQFEKSGHTIRLVSTNPEEETMVVDARAETVEIYGVLVDHGADGTLV